MEHPLIGDLSQLTVEELQNKINELNKKLNWAYRTKNANMIGQIRMALENFTTCLKQKQQDHTQQLGNAAPDFSDRINIS